MMVNAAEAPWLPLVEQARQLDPDPALADVDDDALEGQVRDVAAQLAQLTCQWLEWVAEFVIRGCWADKGARTPGQWLSWACGVGPRAAREYVRVGLALRCLPQTRQRFAAGTLSYSKVRAVTRVATPDTERALVQLADSAPAADLERIIAGARTQLARTTGDPEELDTLAGRVDMPDLSRRTGTDGMVEYRLRLPIELADGFDQQLDRLVERADHRHQQPTLPHDGDDGDGDGDDSGEGEVVAACRVPYGQQQAQALCQAVATAVADTGPDRSGQDRHLIVLHTHLDHLLHTEQPGSAEPEPDADGSERQDGSAEPDPNTDDADGSERQGGSAEPEPGSDDVDGEEPAGSAEPPTRRRRRLSVVAGRHRAMAIPASALRLLACDTLVRPDAGHPADAGRTTRTVPEPLRRALLLRDRGCRFPGCGRTRYLHAHHVIHWADGGPTNLDNLLLLCAFHHRFIHTAHWTLTPVDPTAGHYRFTPPDGTTTDPIGTLPGSAEPAPLEPALPQALQPPWWHGDPYDLSDTINAVAELVLDPTMFFTDPRTHPAHDPSIAA